MALEFYKKKVADLERDLINTKTFLNMVIHDLRNPINNMNFAIDSGLSALKKAEGLLNDYESELLQDMMFMPYQAPDEINNFDESMISEFQSRNPVAAPLINVINNVPIIDPKSNNLAAMQVDRLDE